MIHEKNWHIVFTRQGAEKKVCEQLHKKKVTHFYSTCTWHNNENGKQIIKPLFDRKIFVLIDNEEFKQVLKLEGVLQFVHWYNKPALLKDTEIEIIRNFTALNKNIRIEKTSVKTNGNTATVFVNNKNLNTVKVENKNVIKAFLPSMGMTLVADMERTNADVLSVVRTRYLLPKILTGSFR